MKPFFFPALTAT